MDEPGSTELGQNEYVCKSIDRPSSLSSLMSKSQYGQVFLCSYVYPNAIYVVLVSQIRKVCLELKENFIKCSLSKM